MVLFSHVTTHNERRQMVLFWIPENFVKNSCKEEHKANRHHLREGINKIIVFSHVTSSFITTATR